MHFSTSMLIALLLLPARALATEAEPPPNEQFEKLSWRFGLQTFDSWFGTVRFNTHFPDVKEPPHPASYYHNRAGVGLVYENSLEGGGLLFELNWLSDVWNSRVMKGRRYEPTPGNSWSINRFAFEGAMINAGWIFGDRYRHLPWFTSVTFGLEQSTLDIGFTREGASQEQGRYTAQAVAFAVTLKFHRLVGPGNSPFELTVGPHAALPLAMWQHVNAEAVDGEDVERRVELRSNASLGVHAAVTFRR